MFDNEPIKTLLISHPQLLACSDSHSHPSDFRKRQKVLLAWLGPDECTLTSHPRCKKHTDMQPHHNAAARQMSLTAWPLISEICSECYRVILIKIKIAGGIHVKN